jgi:hypothetical protein
VNTPAAAQGGSETITQTSSELSFRIPAAAAPTVNPLTVGDSILSCFSSFLRAFLASPMRRFPLSLLYLKRATVMDTTVRAKRKAGKWQLCRALSRQE